jgi:hypothetical protein
MDKVSIAGAIENLREELTAAREQGKKANLRFKVESAEIELQIVAVQDTKASGGVSWWVLTGSVEAGHSNTVTQTLKLTLSVAPDASGKDELISRRDGLPKVPEQDAGQ